jgi:hypothetical protein
MSETNAYDYKEYQFLRSCTVTIKNFKRESKITIGNEFEIEFEYFKTIDQTQEDDTGKVTIYGLTPETIAIIEEEGGEIWFDCGYEQAYIENLFIAYISRVYTEKKNNITATTIECSANLLNNFFSGYAISDGVTPIPLLSYLRNLATSIGFGSMAFSLEGVPEDKQESIIKFLRTYKTTSYNIGDLRTILEQTTDYYGLNFRRVLLDDDDTGNFSFTPLGLKKALAMIEKGYPALDNDDIVTDYLEKLIVRNSVEDTDLRTGFLLTKETGLIDSQNEYQLVTAFADQKLNANERETAESEYKRNNPEEPKSKKSSGSEVEALLARSESNSTPQGGDSSNPFLSNDYLSTLNIKPNVVKGTNIREATAGGNVRGHTVTFAHIVQREVGVGLERFTAFNDKYHKDNSPRSLHTQGKSFDFTLKSGKSGAAVVAKAVRAMAQKNGYRVNVDDEYNFPSSKATAGHIHVDVYGKNGDGGTGDTSQDANALPNLDYDQPADSNVDNYGRTAIEINRRYNRITALMNPTVKPQTLVFTVEEGDVGDHYLIHRVRHASYSGNNKRGDWTMVLYCEDTETKIEKGNKVESTPNKEDLASETSQN